MIISATALGVAALGCGTDTLPVDTEPASAAIADPITADDCVTAAAGEGPVNVPLPDATELATVTFTVTPDSQAIDAVIGLSAGPATGFSDLAAAVRLAPNGLLDARDGDGYRADHASRYRLTPNHIRLIADLSSHTYSTFLAVGPEELARQYRFRTEQSAAAHLDHLAVIVDGTQGFVKVCQIDGSPANRVAYSKEGSYAVVALPSDEAVISDGVATSRVDARGRVLASIAAGGQLAVDSVGNVFLANASGSTLSVAKYDAGFQLIWRQTADIFNASSIRSIATDASGNLRVGLATRDIVSVVRFTPFGQPAMQLAANGSNVAIDGEQAIVAWNDGDALHITRTAGNGVTLWTREFPGRAEIDAIATDPEHNVLFGGLLETEMDFGGGTLSPAENPDSPINGFAVELSSTGAHVFSNKLDLYLFGSIASNGSRVVVSGTYRVQSLYARLLAFDANGAPAAGYGQAGFWPESADLGAGGLAVVSPSGRVWWNRTTIWPGPLSSAWPYLVVLTP